MIGQRTTGEEVDLEGAHQTLLVARLNPARGVGIHAQQPAMQRHDTAHGRNSIQAISQFGVARRTWEKPAHQRSVVEAGAADQNRQLAARGDVANRATGVLRVFRGGIDLGRIGDVNQVMRHQAPIGVARLVGADVDLPIDRC